MMAFLAACLLASLLATGSGLQCEVCATVEENCSGSLQPCPAGQDSCGIILTEVTLDGVKFLSIMKGCVTPSQCTAGPTSVYLGIARVRMGTACCTGDACRTVNVTLPPHDTEPNGRRCPACYSAPTGQCREETVNCTGSETQCIESAGTINMGERPFEFTMKGCAFASACDQFQMGSGTFLVPYLSLTTAKCTAASSGTNVPLSTPPPSPASTTSRGAGTALGPARLFPALAGLLLWLLSRVPYPRPSTIALWCPSTAVATCLPPHGTSVPGVGSPLLEVAALNKTSQRVTAWTSSHWNSHGRGYQEATGLNCSKGGSGWTLGKTSCLTGWGNTGMNCLGGFLGSPGWTHTCEG